MGLSRYYLGEIPPAVQQQSALLRRVYSQSTADGPALSGTAIPLTHQEWVTASINAPQGSATCLQASTDLTTLHTPIAQKTGAELSILTAPTQDHILRATLQPTPGDVLYVAQTSKDGSDVFIRPVITQGVDPVPDGKRCPTGPTPQIGVIDPNINITNYTERLGTPNGGALLNANGELVGVVTIPTAFEKSDGTKQFGFLATGMDLVKRLHRYHH
jgi:hypothetical protein